MSGTAARDPAIREVFKRPFAEQVDFFRGKAGNLIPSTTWTDVWKSQHDTGFMVAGAAKADLLADLYREVEKAISQGTGIAEFRANFDEIAAKHGWDYRGERDWRTRVIYQTNISTSYAAGRLAQLRAGGFSYWLYKHSDSVAHPRPQHVAWNGLTLPADHAFWATHSPPNGWGCKCRLVGVRDQAGAKRLGGRWGDDPPAGWDKIDAKTGEPNGIDKGWGYQPGASAVDVRGQLREKLPGLPPPIAQALKQDLDNPPPWDVTTVTGKWHQASMDDAPEWLRKAFAVTGEVKIRERIGSISQLSGDTITMGHPRDTPIGKAVWRHEFGHRMDAVRAKKRFMRSAESDFTDSMKLDGEALKSGSGMGRVSKAQTSIMDANLKAQRQVADELSALNGPQERTQWLKNIAEENGLKLDEFRTWFTLHSAPGDLDIGGIGRDVWEARFLTAWKRGDARGLLDSMEQVLRGENGGLISEKQFRAYDKGVPGMVSDLFSAASGNKVEGCGRHKPSYYRQRSGWGRQAESWANITSITGTGTVGELLLERFAPEMFKAFKDAL